MYEYINQSKIIFNPTLTNINVAHTIKGDCKRTLWGVLKYFTISFPCFFFSLEIFQ